MKGYETFFETIRLQIKNPYDLIVSVIHWILIQEFDFKCVGIGENFQSEHQNINGSELLPSNWNSLSNSYTLLYCSNDVKLSLKCNANLVNNTLFITIMIVSPTSSEISTSICLKDYFEENNLNTQVLDNFKDKIADRLAEDIHQNIFNKSALKSSKSIKNESIKHPSPCPCQSFSEIVDTTAKSRSLICDNLVNPLIGGADLDPIGRGVGGGMIFDPFAGNRLRPQPGPRPMQPRGVIPPGARYDPIGPLPDARFYRPNPDHFPPPRGPGFDNFFL